MKASQLINSTMNITGKDDVQDFNELQQLSNLNVISVNQEQLEEQARIELEKFASEDADSKNPEEGEIVDETHQKRSAIELILNQDEEYIPENTTQLTIDDNKPKKHLELTLDINSFIRRQEELKKHQEHLKSLQVSEHSRNLAKKISQQQNVEQKSKKRSIIKDTNPKTKKIKLAIKTPTNDGSESEYVPSDDEMEVFLDKERPKISRNKSCTSLPKIKDDGSIECYKKRLDQYYTNLEKDVDGVEEYHTIGGPLKIPVKTWENLYKYQKDAVRWLWQLHQKCTGGLLGDEMGLGKTVQIIAFLQALQSSKIVSGRFIGLGPTLIVCPATVLHQWVKHFHEWSPEFRVAVLHQSGSFNGNKNKLIKDMVKDKGILITTYIGIIKFKRVLTEHCWHYFILDEGHKIRNSHTQISMAVKEVHTPHRILLTGSPMQNNLQELWSLFDFIIPGILGSLPTFLEHFVNPIMQGGYANATPMQEATALSVATALKETIQPFLLRRTKNGVRKCISLPHKTEQVLFCSLTNEQKDLYKGYLMSDFVGGIMGKVKKQWYADNQMRANVFVGIMTLRKICNHPDLYVNEFDDDDNNKSEETHPNNTYSYKKSGKMVVVSALLKIWKRQQHRALLFTQSRAMMGIFEKFLTEQNYKYLKMDGTTSISSRQPLIEKFNSDPTYDVFLSTTRVGGIGVNLIGANRVIIYDPDWNPATDVQARERAWRIGQEKQVTIYRLITAGTIEEKIYQRQVWKQLLSNKILLDARTQRFFKKSDLHDLFSLQEDTNAGNAETANIFRNSRINMQEKYKKSKKQKFEKTPIEKNEIGETPESTATLKSSYQRKFEEERRLKLKEKEYLKTLTPAELHKYNRNKQQQLEEKGNKIDDHETNVSFSQALEVTEKSSKQYNEGKNKKTNIGEDSNKSTKHTHSDVTMETHKTARIDGEFVEGLVKKETKKHPKKSSREEDTEDDYILKKLFNKKGVHTALRHDVIVQSDRPENTLRISSEARAKADLALEAIRKSRLNSWGW